MTTKFMWNGIKKDGKLYKAWYSDSKTFYPSEKHPEGVITIHGKGYVDLPKIEGLNIENNTEIMTDYFENDRVRVTPDNPHYPAVLEAMKKQQEHNRKRYEKRYGAA